MTEIPVYISLDESGRPTFAWNKEMGKDFLAAENVVEGTLDFPEEKENTQATAELSPVLK